MERSPRNWWLYEVVVLGAIGLRFVNTSLQWVWLGLAAVIGVALLVRERRARRHHR